MVPQPPKKQPLFSFGKKPEPEVKLAKADWLGIGGFTLDNFVSGGKNRDGVCSRDPNIHASHVPHRALILCLLLHVSNFDTISAVLEVAQLLARAACSLLMSLRCRF